MSRTGATPITDTTSTDRARRTLPHWLLEGLFIVVSVLLGFAATQYGEYRDNRHLAARALASLQAEIEHNLAILEPMVPLHRKWADTLRTADTSDTTKSGLDFWFATRPPLPPDAKSPFAFLGAARGTPPCRAGRCA